MNDGDRGLCILGEKFSRESPSLEKVKDVSPLHRVEGLADVNLEKKRFFFYSLRIMEK